MEIREEHKETCGSIATCGENRREFILKNANDFIKVRLDGGVIPEGQKPECCDFYFYKENEIEIFVELKGKDVSKSLSQLETSIAHFSKKYQRRYAFSVVKSSLPRTDTRLQTFESKMKKQKINFTQKTSKLECIYERRDKEIKIIN